MSAIDGNNRAGAVYLLATMMHDVGEPDVGDLIGTLGYSRLDVRTRCWLERLDRQPPRKVLKAAKEEDDKRVLFLSGCSLHLRGNYEDAYFFYSAAMTLKHPMALIGVANLFRRNKEWTRKPGFPVWRSAQELIAVPRTLAEQRDDIQRAVRAEPKVLTIDERGVEVGGESKVDNTVVDKLVESAISLDSLAVHNLLRMVQPLILNYCRARLSMLTGMASAEDVAQEICMAVLKALPRYQQDGRPFLAFVYGIAAHKVVDARRGSSRSRADAVAEVPDEVSPEPGPEEKAVMRVDALADGAKMSRLLDQLPEKQREVLILRVVVGLSAEETAEACGATPGAVRVAQHRALTKLRQMLIDAGDSEPRQIGGASVRVRKKSRGRPTSSPTPRLRAV